MADCVQASPNGSEFLPFIFQNGAVFKSINASFVDMDYKIYNNPLYRNLSKLPEMHHTYMKFDF